MYISPNYSKFNCWHMWMENSLIMMSSGNYGIAGACWINPAGKCPSECLPPPHLSRPLLTSQGRGFISNSQLSRSVRLRPNLLLSYRAHLSGTLQRAVRRGVEAEPKPIAGDTPHLSLSDPILLLHRNAFQLDGFTCTWAGQHPNFLSGKRSLHLQCPLSDRHAIIIAQTDSLLWHFPKYKKKKVDLKEKVWWRQSR